jgi:hypothetical protein
MSLFFVLLLSIGLPLAYLGTAAVMYSWFIKTNMSKCDDCHGRYTCYKEHGVSAFFMAVIWPIMLPGFLMHHNINPFGWMHESIEAKHQREIAEAEHQVRLAEIKRRELEINERAAGLR